LSTPPTFEGQPLNNHDTTGSSSATKWQFAQVTTQGRVYDPAESISVQRSCFNCNIDDNRTGQHDGRDVDNSYGLKQFTPKMNVDGVALFPSLHTCLTPAQCILQSPNFAALIESPSAHDKHESIKIAGQHVFDQLLA